MRPRDLMENFLECPLPSKMKPKRRDFPAHVIENDIVIENHGLVSISSIFLTKYTNHE